VLNIVSAMASVGAVFAWLEYATGDETFSALGAHLSSTPCLRFIARDHGRAGGCLIFQTPSQIMGASSMWLAPWK
jgi:hypothetical protein